MSLTHIANTPCLLVLKGSRVREYLQQNQRLLAAPDGAVSRTRYNRTWVSASVDLAALQPGLRALMLFSDIPYHQVCPARHGRLVSAGYQAEYLELEFRLEEFVGDEAAGGDCRPALVQALGREPFDDDGKKVFVDLAPACPALGRAVDPAGDVPEASLASWRNTVGFLTTSAEEREHYRNAAFFRPVSLGAVLADGGEEAGLADDLLGEELLVAREVRLDTGIRYRLILWSYNPHLPAEELQKRRLILEDSQGLAFLYRGEGLPRLVADGPVVVEFVARKAGQLRLRVGVAPGGEVSSLLDLELTVRGEDMAGASEKWTALAGQRLAALQGISAKGPSERGRASAIPPEELLRLETWIAETLHPTPADQLLLFREFFADWSPELAIVERHAELAFGQEQWEEVLKLLDAKDQLSAATLHRRFLAKLETGRSTAVVEDARALDWTGQFDHSFGHFLRLVPRLDEETRRALAYALPFTAWGDDKSCDFYRVLMSLECDQELTELIASVLRGYAHLFGLGPDEALAWVLGQAERSAEVSPQMLDEVVYWAEQATHREPAVDLLAQRLLPAFVRRRGLPAAEDLLRRLSGVLDLDARLRLWLCLADQALPGPAGRAAAVDDVVRATGYLADLLTETILAGDLITAEYIALRLDCVLASVDTLPLDARKAAADSVKDYRAFAAAWVVERGYTEDQVGEWAGYVGQELRGKTIRLFTGHQGGDAVLQRRFAPLAQLLALPCEVHSLEARKVTDRLKPGSDVVIILTRWCSHADTGYLQTRCKKAKVPCYVMPQRVVNHEAVVRELAQLLGFSGQNGSGNGKHGALKGKHRGD